MRHVSMLAARGGARQAGEAVLRTGTPRHPVSLLPGLFNNSYRLPQRLVTPVTSPGALD
ncbi:hypothetical protein R0J90_01465 [Micrococcus sp. SIMBA_144]